MAQTVPAVSDAVFRALTESSPDGIILVDQEGKIVLVNLQTEKLFGYRREELLGHAVEILVPERLRGRHRGHRAGFMGHPQVRPMGAGLELFGLRKDKTEFPIEISLSPIQARDGMLVCTAIRDITDRKRIEERLRRLLDSAPDAMVIAGNDGRIVLVNTQTEKLFGYKREELLGQPVEVLVPERFWNHHRTHRSNYMVNPQSRAMGAGSELYGLKKDGTEFPVEISLSPQQTDEGVLVSSTIRDITERKRVDDALRQSEANFRAMIEGTYGVYRATPEGQLLVVNEALVKMLGYDSAEELLARNLATDIFEKGEYTPLLFDQPGTRKQFAKLEAHWKQKDGKIIPVEISGRAVRDEAGNVLYFEVIAENVSHVRGVEQRLRHVQKMEAIGRLAGGIAHDFNNVLGVIVAYSEMLVEKLSDNAELSPLVTSITKAVERGGTLTRQLLAFSRQQVLEPQVISFSDHLEGIKEMLARVIGEDIRLEILPGNAKLRVKVDPTQLEQVIMNLVVNARDAMPDGGRLTIENSEIDIDDEYCSRNPEARPGRHAMMAVTDSGCGMTPEVLSRIFEPFFTTKEQGKGTGLGLATIYGIVKQSGGHITAYSEVGRGTTFKVYLPATQEEIDKPEVPSQERVAPRGEETILVVEDEESLRSVTREFLSNKGYQVIVAEDFQKALEASENNPQHIDLLMTDVVLPGSSGPKLADRLATARPEMKVLFVSGYTADALVHGDLHRTDFAFLSKPFSLNTLARKIRTILDAKSL
ncbi:MAG TPA: PAS domain S-box protein [Candidatus Acidoferrum sp.]|jgi:two-component system cell cycle sensor histidine kinase/response regulator CckA|nr:PAS domain S-box protein [Candidatus Acidoferrum sp.]